jgi:hypothetical protein
MMEYKACIQRDERDGGRDEKRRHGSIREIRAIRGSQPESDHGFHGVPGFSGGLALVAPSRTQANQSDGSSRFNPPSLKLRWTRVQSSKSRQPVALGQTQSNRSHATEANEANEAELPCSEPAPRQIPFVAFATFCARTPLAYHGLRDFHAVLADSAPVGQAQSHPVKPSQTSRATTMKQAASRSNSRNVVSYLFATCYVLAFPR